MAAASASDTANIGAGWEGGPRPASRPLALGPL
jgi:hypothetical protein